VLSSTTSGCRADDGVEVEGLLGEPGELGQGRLVEGGEVEHEERLGVHDVGRVEVGVELVHLAVGEDRDARVGHREVPDSWDACSIRSGSLTSAGLQTSYPSTVLMKGMTKAFLVASWEIA
jgi:hypothetical protein